MRGGTPPGEDPASDGPHPGPPRVEPVWVAPRHEGERGDPSGPVPPGLPGPRPSPWSGVPWIWAVPIVALLIAGWLGFHSLIERGPTIRISFATGDGIEAGRTTIRYKNVELGRVVRLGFSHDHSRVVAIAEMTREAKPMLRADTKFWVVRPRVGLSGISGLGTLVSGAYVGMLPGDGAPEQRDFAGLAAPPPEQGLAFGQDYTLYSSDLKSLGDQAPVYFHGVKVGEVTGHELSDKSGTVAVHIFIYRPHQDLIRPSTRFWVSSGVQVSVGPQGLKLATESLQTLLTGGIVFDTPEGALTAPPSPAGAIFHLYPNPSDAADAADPLRVAYRLYFAGSLHGVMVDTPVELRGLTIGHVSSVHLEYDPVSGLVRVPVTIKIALNKILVHGQAPFALDQQAQAGVAANRLFSRLIAEGLRARLVSGNLLTGARVVSLSFVKDAAPATLVSAKPYPEFPTAPGSGLEEITKSASTLMNNLAALPLGSLVGEVRDMVRHTDGLVGSPELRRSLKELDRTLASAQTLTGIASQRIGPLMDRLDSAAKQLNATLTLLGDDPKSSVDLASTMAELRDAARSVKVLSTFLERNPQALLLGKPEDALR